MRREEARRLLDEVNHFMGQDWDDLDLEKKADSMFHAMEKAGFQCKPEGNFDALELQQCVEKNMEILCRGGKTVTKTEISIKTHFTRIISLNTKGRPSDITRRREPLPSLTTDGSLEGVIMVITMLLFMADIKQVIKCKYCEKYLFSVNKRQKFCVSNNNKCKNDFNNKNRTPEQVEVINMRRAEKRKGSLSQ